MDTLNVTIKIKRGNGKPEELTPYELAYDETNNILYIGDSNGSPVVIVDKFTLERTLEDKINVDTFIEFKELLYNSLQKLQQDISANTDSLEIMQENLEKANNLIEYNALREQIRKNKLNRYFDL